LKGDSNIATLVQSTGLSGKMIREALFVLIHHSLVLYNSTSSPSTLYRIDVDAILNRVAYGKIVAKVAEKVSVEAADLLLEIIVAGRVKFLEITDHSESLRCLLNEGIIEVVTTEMCQFSYETAAVPVGDKRKLDEELLFPSNSKKSKTAPGTPVTESSQIFIRFKSKETIFRLIFTEKLVESVTRRLNRSAGKVVETILELSSSLLTETEITFNTFQLTQKLPKDLTFPLETSSSAGGLAASPLLQYLHLLAQNFDYLQAQSSLGANAFSFNVTKALRYLRLMLIESFIRARFGIPSARIFKILLSKRMYEERQIAKVAMITSKEVRERLYALLKVGLVYLQEVPKSADHAPSRTIFLWSVPERANYLKPSKSALFQTFTSKLVVGIVNLRDLTVLERRKHSQLLEKVERSDVASNLDLLSHGEQKQLADLKKILKVLNVKIDQIFNEFLIFKE
jgi:hypothetical protein